MSIFFSFILFLCSTIGFAQSNSLAIFKKIKSSLEEQKSLSHQNNYLKTIETADSFYSTLSKFIRENPGSPFRELAETYLGEFELIHATALKAKGKAEVSKLIYERSFERLYSQSSLARISRKYIIEYADVCSTDKISKTTCAGWLDRMTFLFPRNAVPPKIQDLISNHKKQFNSEAASRDNKNSSIIYKIEPDQEAFKLAFQAYENKSYSNAQDQLSKLLENFPRTSIRLRTKYWLAKTLVKLNKKRESQQFFVEIIRELPFSFYALLSSWELGINISEAIDTTLPEITKRDAFLYPEDHTSLLMAEKLIKTKELEFAQIALSKFKIRSSMTTEFLIYLLSLAYASKTHFLVTQISSELSSRGYTGHQSTYGESVMFPKIYTDEAQELGTKYKLDPLVILSLIKQESAFRKEVVSSSNAYGLMQIIAPTAYEVDSNIEVHDLFVPKKNIEVGTKYLTSLLQRTKGDLILALAGYNAGPHNADRWKKEIPLTANPDEAIEHISFRETHDYVQNIIRNYYWYSKRHTGEAFSNLSALLDKFTNTNQTTNY